MTILLSICGYDCTMCGLSAHSASSHIAMSAVGTREVALQLVERITALWCWTEALDEYSPTPFSKWSMTLLAMKMTHCLTLTQCSWWIQLCQKKLCLCVRCTASLVVGGHGASGGYKVLPFSFVMRSVMKPTTPLLLRRVSCVFGASMSSNAIFTNIEGVLVGAR